TLALSGGPETVLMLAGMMHERTQKPTTKAVVPQLENALGQAIKIALNAPRPGIYNGYVEYVTETKRDGQSVPVVVQHITNLTSEAMARIAGLSELSPSAGIEVHIQLPQASGRRTEGAMTLARQGNEQGGNIFVAKPGQEARRLPPRVTDGSSID